MDERQSTRVTDDWARTFDAVPDLMMILDNQHRVVRANRAMALRMGCAPEDLVGQTCYQVVHNAHTPPMFCPHARLLADGTEHAVEVYDERLGGTFLVSVSPISGPGGTIMGSVHVARDISEQKRAESLAVEAVRQRDQFLAMLSHELRNPLGAILNAACVVKRMPAQTGPFGEALAVIERQAQQMSALLDDLLDISRVMQGKIALARDEIDLAVVLADAVAAVRPLMESRHQTLAVDVTQAPLMIRGDAARLQQIQVNLLMNAAKFTPPGGQISFRLQLEDHDAVLSVEDNGIGIAGGMLESVFELFVQADATLHRQQGGLGIGLTLVRMLVEMHGGRVTAHSRGLGQGSRFVVRLPLLVQADLPQCPPPLPPVPTPLLSRVLVVEDNADVRSMLLMLLSLEGHEVQAAADGSQGLETLTREAFDVALIDIGLPGLDGYEVARRARAACGEHCPRLVALTGYGRPSDRAAVRAAGFDEHLVKPCDPEDLLRMLAQVQ
jgi:two-component system, chemotaxis family, CheB/CheR fusion protein